MATTTAWKTNRLLWRSTYLNPESAVSPQREQREASEPNSGDQLTFYWS